jgi:DNA replication and repair protein RecF
VCHHAHAFVNSSSVGLTRLQLRNFRNYERLELSLSPGVTVFQGDNGQGKTNILEAVYYLAVLRSFRTSRISDLVRTGCDGFHARIVLNSAMDSEVCVSATYAQPRRLFIDECSAGPREFINQFNCVSLVPEDIELTKGSPAVRRRYLNILLSQLFPDYLDSLIRYTKVLKNRNAMLRNADRYGQAAITAYDSMFAEHGAKLMRLRYRVVDDLNSLLARLLPRLNADETGLTMKYKPAVSAAVFEKDNPEEQRTAMINVLNENLERDMDQGQTRYGPHRDELGLMIRGNPLDSFGSEGQCRLAALAMKLVAANMLAKEMNQKKSLVLLVDDVFGELDSDRKKGFFDTVADAGQVLLTCTEAPSEILDRNPRILNVKNGRVQDHE